MKYQKSRSFHGLTKTTLYKKFSNIKDRCYNPNYFRYKDYGGRGITICKEWLASPKNFIDWALKNNWEPGLLLDRKNNNGPYSPENCRWVSTKLSAQNRRSTIFIEHNGKQYPFHVLAKQLGIVNPDTAYCRYSRYKWDAIKACTTPAKRSK